VGDTAGDKIKVIIERDFNQKIGASRWRLGEGP
jgi:hypothetical protein